MNAILAVAVLLASTAAAFAEEKPIGGKALLGALMGARAEGNGWSQTFEPGGTTIYDAKGTQSAGRWDVRGDEYCSLWPPSDVWACYAVHIDPSAAGGPEIVWIGSDGSRSTTHLVSRGQ